MRDRGPHVLIVTAVDAEMAAIRARVEPISTRIIGKRPVLVGVWAGAPVRLMATGPGALNTAQAVTAAVEAETPALILMAGCGGGFAASQVKVGDLAVATEEIDIHLGIEPDGPDSPPIDLPFSVLETGDRPGRYPLSRVHAETAFRAVCESLGPAGATVHRGTFITVSTVTATDERADLLHGWYRPVIAAMEGAAAAHVARWYHIPLIEVRAAANGVGRRQRDRWELALAFERCAAAAGAIIAAQSEITPA